MASEPSPQEIEAIADALASNRKIEAIKIYRESTGKGLKEAKDFIDALGPKLKEQNPDRFANLSGSGAGCASAIAFALCLAGILLLVMA